MGLLSNAVDMLRVRWLMATTTVTLRPEQLELRFCYDTLQHVSRSFAVVIMQLRDEPLRDGICVFYLVLRALDTVEDDMRVPVETKLRELPKFHTHLSDPAWHLDGVGSGHERALLERFALLSAAYRQLRPAYRGVIADICARMAAGMCDFLQRPVVTRGDYDLYCHYVAGLVGHGLTRLFACCGFESAQLADDLSVANHMGLFLQKTNIIRDYYEDVCEDPPRIFWPREVWSAARVDTFAQLRDAAVQPAALRCLNAMVADAMTHVPYVLDYLAQLRDPSVFRFCAIPQVMAMATLALVYNNPRTFHAKVKIRRAEACRIMLRCGNLCDALHLFRAQCSALLARLDVDDVANTTLLRQQLLAAQMKIDLYTAERAPALYSRSLLLRYPALGGRLVLAWVDSVAGYFGGVGVSSSSSPRLPHMSRTADTARCADKDNNDTNGNATRIAQPVA